MTTNLEDRINYYKIIAENRENDLKFMTKYKNELSIKNTNLYNENVDLLNKYSKLEESYKELENSYERLEDDFRDLKEIYNASKDDEINEIKKLEDEYENAQIKLGAIELNYKDAQYEISRLCDIEEKYEELKDINQVLLDDKKKNDNTTKDHNELLLDFKNLEKQYEYIEDNYKNLAYKYTGLEITRLAIEDELYKLAKKEKLEYEEE